MQKKSHAGGEGQAEQFSSERLRGPNCSALCMSLFRHADAFSAFLLVSLASSYEGRLRELNTYGLATGSLRKAVTMLSNI